MSETLNNLSNEFDKKLSGLNVLIISNTSIIWYEAGLNLRVGKMMWMDT